MKARRRGLLLPLLLLPLASGCLGGAPPGLPEGPPAPAAAWTAADCSTRILQFVSEAAPVQERLPPGYQVRPVMDQEAHPMAFNEAEVTSCTAILVGNDTLVRGGAFAVLATSVRGEDADSRFYALLVCSPSPALVAAFASAGFEAGPCAIDAGPDATRVGTPDGAMLVRHQPVADGVSAASGVLPRDYCQAPPGGPPGVAHAVASRGQEDEALHAGSVAFDGVLGSIFRPHPAAAYLDMRSGAVALAFRHEPVC